MLPLFLPRRVLRTISAVLFLLAACHEPEPYALRRQPLSGRAPEVLEAGAVSRAGVRLGEGDVTVATELLGLTAGRISLFAAPAEEAAYGGELDVELRETGWRSWLGLGVVERCALRWGEAGTIVETAWQGCSFELARPVRSARLELTRRGRIAGDLLVSDVRVAGNLASASPNVFVVVLDAARFDQLRPFRADAGVGDALEALARDSVLLRNLHSSSSWTRPAVATLFTGLRASRHRVQERGDVLDKRLTTLPQILRAQGYWSAGWSTNPNVLTVWGMTTGFDVFVDQGGENWATGKTDGAIVMSRLRAALAVRGAGAGFYYLHLMDPHGPYRPSKQQREAAEKIPSITSLFPRPMAIMSKPVDWSAFLDYTGELLDTDDHVATFMRMLQEEGLYENSLILVLADHGEEFIDHGGRDHGLTLYEEVLHVPALVKLPGNRLASSTLDSPISFEDLMPTVLDALGIDVPPGIDGRVVPLDSAGALEPRPHVATLRLDGRRQVAILDPPWKFIRNDFLGGKELYNLDSDPRERTNVVIWHPEEVARLSAELESKLSRRQEGWHVLLCGTLQEASMDLLVSSSAGTPELFGFDDGEAVEVPDQPGVLHLRPVLAPRSVERAVFGRMVNVPVADHAEVLVPAADAVTSSTLKIEAASDQSFDYALAISSEVQSARSISLDSTAKEAIGAEATRIECDPPAKPPAPPPTARRPFVRVWYVPPPEKIAEDKLDPGLRERLRALGYLQ